MALYDYDLFVIGGGSGGVRAARMASGYGAKVGIAEEYRWGGTCVIRGCVPKKLLVYASHVHDEIADAAGFGWTIPEAQFSWPKLIENKDKEIARLSRIYVELLTKAKVEVIEAHARLVDRHTIELDGRQVRAKTILLATGGKPERPRIPGIEHSITSNEAFHLPHLPKRVAVVGGGYIAAEFAGIFNGLGAKTHLLYRGAPLLRGFDGDVRAFVTEEIRKKGVDLRTNSDVEAIEPAGTHLRLKLKGGESLDVDQVLYATGRVPNTEGLGLEAAGVDVDKKGIIRVDGHSRTSIENIYAIGDCTDRLALTPVAIKEAMAFVDTVFGGKPWAMDHSNVAHAVFCQPQVATVGMSEVAARSEGRRLDIYKTNFKPLKATLSGSTERVFMKLVVDRASQVVLGVHMVGADAAEIIQSIAIAVKMGATKAQFDQTVALHPTAAEEFVTMRTPEPEPVEPGLEDMQAAGE
ncbi:glutathione-disulfide reductase [Dongia sp.]|uniref:glutathione-disulfide reductase n=1 Tax=Dongia sp. TaxID=1977262 RepID=UPI0037531827